MLSPAEALGLSGATLDSRIRRAVAHVSDAALMRVAERLRADALANELVYERKGVREPIRVMLRPLLAMPDQLSYVHHVCVALSEALKRVPELYLHDERVRQILAITPGEERWLRETWTPGHQRFNPLYGRLDAVCDFTGAGWQDSLRFMEPNMSGVGGIHFGPLAEQLVMHNVVPTLVAHDPELAIELPRDQRDLFLQVLMDHARDMGRPACQLCLIDAKYVAEGPAEQEVLSEFLAERGLVAMHADPRELRVAGEEVFYGDVRVDVAYRDYDARDLVALEAETGEPLEAMRLLFRQNRMVSSLVGDFDHKSCWELLTDESIAEQYFDSEECRLFRRHVLWTRVVSDRRTTLPRGGESNLIEYARLHRDQLVMKPNRGYGGTGVVLGAAMEQAQWEAQLEEAAALGEDPERSWVVQSLARLPVHEFPVVGANGRVFGEPYYAVMGFAASENGLSILCRVSQKQVVNVAQHGGLAAVLVGHPPPRLRTPRRTAGRIDGAAGSLRAQITELTHLDQAIALLEWDEETMLPPAARTQRGEQLATLEGIRHLLLVSDHLGDLVEEVAEQHVGDDRWGRELALLRRLRRHAIALPVSLVRAFANAKARSLGAWEEARVSSDYALFAPAFEQVLALVRERALALAHGPDTYDALLDEHEPGMTRARLEPVLMELREGLVPLVRDAAEAGPPAGLPGGQRYAASAQWELCRRLLQEMGFAFERGRLDRSTHPFTLAAGGDDVRLTLRTDEEDPTKAVMATLHEGGHGLYDQGFLAADRDSLLGEAASMGLHESQSRLWENHVGRSLPFWRHWLPALRTLFGEAMAGLDAEDFHRALNQVRPGVDRVSADEASYHLHILLRYELELALLSGTLGVGELPAAWRERSAALIGVAPDTDRDGVLQDVHWSLGMFGYFPSYSVGSLYAAQLAERYARDHPLEEEIGRGAFANLATWLRRHVHEVGNRASAEDIVARVTGRGLDAAAYFRHLEASVVSLHRGRAA
jgi:carboxypeptidase Taq